MLMGKFSSESTGPKVGKMPGLLGMFADTISLDLTGSFIGIFF